LSLNSEYHIAISQGKCWLNQPQHLLGQVMMGLHELGIMDNVQVAIHRCHNKVQEVCWICTEMNNLCS